MKIRCILLTSLIGFCLTCSMNPSANKTVISNESSISMNPLSEKISDNWKVFKASVLDDGAAISQIGYDTSSCISTKVPATIHGILADNNVYGNLFLGDNFDSTDALVDGAYWFRTEIDSLYVKNTWIVFKGISGAAEIWLNGKKLDSQQSFTSPFTSHQYPVSGYMVNGKNVLAVRISNTEMLYPIAWNDWNKFINIFGIIRDVYLYHSEGNIGIDNAYVVTSNIDFPGVSSADLTVDIMLRNNSTEKNGFLRGEISKNGAVIAAFNQSLFLGDKENKKLQIPVTIKNPKLWWPYQLGSPDLYSLNVWVDEDGIVSDSRTFEFGIRKISEYHTPQGWWGLKINNTPLFVKGAMYSPEIFLRFTKERNEAEMEYFKSMGLNTIRFEGFTTNDDFFDLCDREGIIVMNGENCIWETNNSDEHMDSVKRQMLNGQMRDYRSHASFGIFNSGSDTSPSASQLVEYEDILSQYDFRTDNAYAKNVSDFSFVPPWDGIKMMGPYNYENPKYFWEGAPYDGGGAWGFCAEQGVGAVFPEYESIVKFIPTANLWPIDKVWISHAFTYNYKTSDPLELTLLGINGRYGTSTSAEEFIKKAQLSQYESVRSMFESYQAMKSDVFRPSTGVIMWMFNMALPGVGTQLHDYYLKPTSATFAVQKACSKKLHVMYDYSSKSVWLNNESSDPFEMSLVSAKIYNLDMSEKFNHEETVVLSSPNTSRKIFSIDPIADLSAVYFIKLQLKDISGVVIDDNVYWYASSEDKMDYVSRTINGCRTVQNADLTSLSTLPINSNVSMEGTRSISADNESIEITVTNNSASNLAFFMRAEVTSGADGSEVLPVTYSDNYISLWPKEIKKITAKYRSKSIGGNTPFLRLQGYNVSKKTNSVIN